MINSNEMTIFLIEGCQHTWPFAPAKSFTPWPYMTGEFRRNFDKLEQSLIEMRTELGDAPKAVLVVSAIGGAKASLFSSGAKPGMVYDCSGFPEDLYHITYCAPGSPDHAKQVQELLRAGGVEAQLDPARGFDHGTFSIMKPLYPGEELPVVQLSLDAGYDPALHLAVGRALESLRDERVLIIGSCLSYHNLRVMSVTSGYEPSRRLDAWLQQTLIHSLPDERAERLLGWRQAPFARAAHPREDHLIPLMVAVGAAGDEPGAVTYHQGDFFGELTASSFRFGNPLAVIPTKGEVQ